MNGPRGEGGSEERANESWATESLPMAVRKELLERELDRMGLRKGHGPHGAPGGGTTASQHTQGSHPQADAATGDATHGD
jgi:hypothetical protein